MDEATRKIIADLQNQANKTSDPELRRDLNNTIEKLRNEVSNTSTNTGDDKNPPPKGDFDLSKTLLSMFEAGKAQSTIPDNTDYLSSLLNNISQSTAKGPIAIADGLVQTVLGGMGDYVREQSYLLTLVNKELNLAGKLSQDFRTAVTEAQPDLVRMGIPFQDMTKSIETLIEDTGRFALVGTEMLKEAGQIAAAYGMSMEDVIGAYSDFENVGIGAADAQEAMGEAGKRSLEVGIQSRQTIQGMIENIGELNKFGFQNGIEGLEKMVRRATEVRMELSDVFNVADKVFDPEGALELSANLQVLGAAFGDFNDPIRLMYMATNEVEGLQGALEGVASNLATYNEETGGFEVTGANLRQARDIAKALGIDLENINKTAIALQERGQVDMAVSGLGIDEDDKAFLANISRMKEGKMQIELMTPELQSAFGGASVALEDLSSEGVKQLLEYRDQFKELSQEDLVRHQVTLVENVARDVNYLATLGRLRAAGVGDELMQTFAGMSFKEAGVEFSDILKMNVDDLVKSFGTRDAARVQDIQSQLGILDDIKEAERKQQENFKENNTRTVKLVQTVHHSSDQMMSGIQKELTINSELYRQQGLGAVNATKDDYLTTN